MGKRVTAPPAGQQVDEPKPDMQPLNATLPGGAVLKFRWSFAGQHTIYWDEPLRSVVGGVTATVGPGELNLYAYPRVLRKGRREAEALPAGQLEVVAALLTAIATDSDGDEAIFDTPDASGATPLLGLTVSNTPEAVALSLAIYRLRPRLIGRAHFPGPFAGENVFHVFAVNRQEDALIAVLILAHDHLSAVELQAAITSQVTGGFFTELATSRYGGTPLAFAACFCLRRAVSLMLSFSDKSPKMRGILSLNSP